MSLYTNIRGTLQSHLMTCPGIPQNFAWEGARTEVTVNVPYVSSVLVPAEDIMTTMGPSGLFRHSGSFEISLVYPSQGKTATIEALGDAVREHFRTGTVLELNGFRLRISSAEREQLLIEADWIRLPISVGWFVYTTEQ